VVDLSTGSQPVEAGNHLLHESDSMSSDTTESKLTSRVCLIGILISIAFIISEQSIMNNAARWFGSKPGIAFHLLLGASTITGLLAVVFYVIAWIMKLSGKYAIGWWELGFFSVLIALTCILLHVVVYKLLWLY
jgi:hypothetical protein